MISAARAFLSHRPARGSLGFAAREHHDDDETDGDDDNENDGANRDADPEPDARRRRRLWRFGLGILGFFQRYVERGRWWIIVDGSLQHAADVFFPAARPAARFRNCHRAWD